MQIWLQWARRNPQDYQPLGSEGWAGTASKADPSRGTPYALNELNQQNGWVAELNVQGIMFSADHYHVADLTDGSLGIVVTSWNDQLPFAPVGQRSASVWTILPLAPDGRLGGAINTRQSQVIYAEGQRLVNLLANPLPENTTVRTWAEFALPPDAATRHGIWLTDAAWNAHVAARTSKGWRD
jgi:hypothetical protein